MKRAFTSCLVLLAAAACGSAVGQGTEYTPPNDLPIGEPTDRSGEPDGGRRPSDAAAADARLDAPTDGG